jgi:hypothetical protein
VEGEISQGSSRPAKHHSKPSLSLSMAGYLHLEREKKKGLKDKEKRCE